MIRLSKSSINDNEKQAVLSVLDREYLGMGKDVGEFEDKLASFFNRSVVCTNSGTSALQLAVQSAGIGEGDEVLVQSLTFVACFQAVSATGAIPIPCEILPNTFTIDLEDAAEKLNKRTKAIMPVHYSGGAGDLAAVYRFAEDHGLRVIEDASHGFGTIYEGKLLGSFGDTACFSFDGIKNITCGEGGVIVSSDSALLEKASDLRLLGVKGDTKKRFEGRRSWKFDVDGQGWRYHMSNINAAIGAAQLDRYPEFKKKRQDLAQRYLRKLAEIPLVRTLALDYSQVVPHIFVIRLDDRLDRDGLIDFLEMRGIQTGLHYYPNHRLEFFNPGYRYSLPITDYLFDHILTIPLHTDLTYEEQDIVIAELAKYCNCGSKA